MENNESPQTEIMLNIWNILTTVDGNTVTIANNLQIRTAQLSPADAVFDTCQVHYPLS
ncbi:MAG TPA: hypothetical protein VJM74_01465 [Nitrososphaeraceae archaeon]|jgi:hypothetical protein|nr:hypothetical protein [Nitrososphaeraceae archaeon]